ncbi:MAG: TatD family hydrolase [Bacteroidia bacterium]
MDDGIGGRIDGMSLFNDTIHWLDVHTHRKTHCSDVFFIRNGYIPKQIAPVAYAVSYGLHPWFVNSNWKTNLQILETHLEKNRPLLIGECGLDRLRGGDFMQQQEAFEQQIVLAQKFRVPLVIHQVRAFDEILLFKKKFSDVSFILHGFRGAVEQVKRCLDHKISFSLGAYVLTHASKLSEMIQTIPADRLYLETDTSPKKIEEIYAAVASVRKMNLDELRTQTLCNFEQILSHA